MRAALGLLIVLLAPAAASAQQARPEDRAAIEACLKDAGDTRERCVGSIYAPCTETPEGGTTAGMGDCAGRETAVWTERMDASLATLLNGPLGRTVAEPYNRPNENKRAKRVKGADVITDMQRAWVSLRAKKCDVEAMQAEGGTLSRVLYGICIYEETARHALWLKALVDEAASR